LKKSYINPFEIINKNDFQTSEEKISNFDDKLILSLGEFDEMLLIENEKITEKKDDNGGIKNAHSQKKYKQLKGIGTKNNDNNKQSDNDISKNASRKDKNKPGKRERLDKIRDDVVSRQLKEAAENEKNPELKEKLWNEYYKYKDSPK